MKPTTARMLVEVVRNVRGILSVFERWVRQEGKIGSVSLSPGQSAESSSGSANRTNESAKSE